MFTGYSGKAVGISSGSSGSTIRASGSNPRKAEFDQLVMEPTKALANELYDWFQEKYPALGLNLHISRIYRDARRLFGRGPLNDHIWFSFQNAIEHRDGAPNFWFQVGADGYGLGFGYWMRAADAARMRKINRSGRQADGKAGAAVARQDMFTLTGEEYAKPKGHADDLLGPWYNKRWIGFRCIRPYDAVSASQLLTFAEDGFRFMIPYYQYFDQIYRMADWKPAARAGERKSTHETTVCMAFGGFADAGAAVRLRGDKDGKHGAVYGGQLYGHANQ